MELEVPVGSTLTSRAVTTDVAAELQLQIAVLVGTVLQDFRDGRRSALLDTGSVRSPATGGSPALALAPELVLEASELSPESSGSRPMISSTTRLLPFQLTRITG